MDSTDIKPSGIQFISATAEHAGLITVLIYQSAHELMDFMFGSQRIAEPILNRLLKNPSGQFGYRYITVMQDAEAAVGVVLGYSRKEFMEAEIPGAINMLRATPFPRWFRLATTVNKALSNYVPPPAADAFYINNIAVDENLRGKGYGGKLLARVIEQAKQRGFRCIELDVTHINEAAIRFYQRNGFSIISESGSKALFDQYQLPLLKRMRLVIDQPKKHNLAHNGQPTSSRVVSEVTGLYPVCVDEVYVPGTIEQLQKFIKHTDAPFSVGGGRFSMGGQTALEGTTHIDLRGLNKIIELDAKKRTIRVQSGTRWKEVQDYVNDYGLAVKIMQTYSNFTVGGSLSVNCHGRYVGLGPVIFSVKSIDLLRHDGEIVRATPNKNKQIFYASIGCYGAVGIIVAAELELAKNCTIERLQKKMPLLEYPQYFASAVRENQRAVFHNADMIPPNFDRVRALSWQETDKPVNRSESTRLRLFLMEKYMLWAITETPAGHFRREYIYEPLMYLRRKVVRRNQEANYDVAELEPLSRTKTTYVLQEYFVAVDRLLEFKEHLCEILTRYRVKLVNISIRHAHTDPGSMLAWAREEVFAFVLYYKQGTQDYERESVAVWTRELIESAIKCGGSYYLPYQPHARYDQFHAAYPSAIKLFKLKDKLDPNYRFRNILWEKYYRQNSDTALLPDKSSSDSEFLSVYGQVTSRDGFYRFLQVIYHLYPHDQFHQLIIKNCQRHQHDVDIYRSLNEELPAIKTKLSDFTYALPALAKQKSEMQRQTLKVLQGVHKLDGYLEIGSTGRYVKHLQKALALTGEVFLCNDNSPDFSPAEIMERGGLKQVGEFFPLNDYEPIPESIIADSSLDLVTCYIGLHHCPREKLSNYIASIYRVLRPSGRFVLRDHDAGGDEMRVFCSLVHTVFNAGLGVSWEQDRSELRLFESVQFWVEEIVRLGFSDSGQRLLQAHDPSLNTLLCFQKS